MLRRLLLGATATAVATAVLPPPAAEAAADTSPPVVTVSVPTAEGDDGWHTTPPTVGFSARDLGSGVAYGTVTVSGATTGALEVVDGQASHVVTTSGVTTFTYEFGDEEGNVRRGSRDVKVDVDAPTAAVTGGPSHSVVRVGDEVVLTPSCADVGSGVATCRLHGNVDPTTGRLDTSVAGGRQVWVLAEDAAGHVTNTSRYIDVIQRDTAPSVDLTVPPPSATGWHTTRPWLVATGSAGHPSLPVTGIRYSVGGVLTMATDTTARFSVATEGRDIPVVARAVDVDGGVSPEVVRHVSVDTSPPLGTIAGPETYEQGQVVAPSVLCQDAVSGVAECSVVAGAGPDGTTDTRTVGPLRLELLVRDRAGHTTRVERVVEVVPAPEPDGPSTLALEVAPVTSSRAPVPVVLTLGGAGVVGGVVRLHAGLRSLGEFTVPAGAPGGVSRLRVLLPPLAVGTHRLEGSYLGAHGALPAAATPRPVLVRSPARVTVRHATTRGRHVAAVRVVGFDAPATGRVELLDRGRRIGTATLRGARTAIRVTLRRGVHRLQVRYLGSTRVLPAASTTRIVRMR